MPWAVIRHQSRAIQQLLSTVQMDRQAHALIFSGLSGVGKRLCAYELASLLLCDTPRTGNLSEGCGVCPPCKLVDAQTHPDIHRIHRQLKDYHPNSAVRSRKATVLSVDVVREFLLEKACSRPSMGRGKVFIVEDAQLISPQAQNALLKTLEEPPADTTIILIDDGGRALLPTTRSRCQTIRFRPLPDSFIVERLADVGVVPEQATCWARIAQGSLGMALMFAASSHYQAKREWIEQLATAGSQDPLNGSAWAIGWAKEMEEMFRGQEAQRSAEDANRTALLWILEVASLAFRDALAMCTGAQVPLVHAEQGDRITELANQMGEDGCIAAIRAVNDAATQIRANGNTTLTLDNFMLECAVCCQRTNA